MEFQLNRCRRRTFDLFVLNLLVDTGDEMLYVISGLRQHVDVVQGLNETAGVIGRRSVVIVVDIAPLTRHQPQSVVPQM